MEKMEKEACNFPIQSTGASMIKEAITEIHHNFKNKKPVRIILTVHDEIVLQAPAEIAEEVMEEARKIMIGMSE